MRCNVPVYIYRPSLAPRPSLCIPFQSPGWVGKGCCGSSGVGGEGMLRSGAGGEGCGVGGVGNIAFCIFEGSPDSDRTKLKTLQSWSMPFGNLKAHMTIKANELPHYQAFLEEIEHYQRQQSKFANILMEYLVDCDRVDQVSVGVFVCATFMFSNTP